MYVLIERKDGFANLTRKTSFSLINGERCSVLHIEPKNKVVSFYTVGKPSGEFHTGDTHSDACKETRTKGGLPSLLPLLPSSQ